MRGEGKPNAKPVIERSMPTCSMKLKLKKESEPCRGRVGERRNGMN